MITEKQKLAIRLIAEGYKTHEVAEMVGVHRATLWRWEYREDYQRYKRKYMNAWWKAWCRKQNEEIEREMRKLEALLDHKNPYVANWAANEILKLWVGFENNTKVRCNRLRQEEGGCLKNRGKLYPK